MPESLAPLALQNKREVYNLLFRAASQTLLKIAADPKHLGAEIGFLAILHTWGQNLMHHPHLHCVVPGGGLSPDSKRWIGCRESFFLPVRVLSRLFRRLFLQYLQESYKRNRLQFHGSLKHLGQAEVFSELVITAQQTEWIVYAKPPFGGPRQVLQYLGRYTHRVAISNNRLVSCEDGKVSFYWKDYRNGNRTSIIRLEANEFIRRFLLHVLPNGFQRIRYFGWMGNCHRAEKLELCRTLLKSGNDSLLPDYKASSWQELYEELTGCSLSVCPMCHQGRMILIEYLLPSSMNTHPP